MPRKQVISDDALSRALGMYAGMVSRVLNNPQRWLGVDEEPPLTAGWPVRVLDAVRDPRPRRCQSRLAAVGRVI